MYRSSQYQKTISRHTLAVGLPQQATLHTRLDPQIATGAENSASIANIADIIPTC